MAAGRPSKYNKGFCDRLVDYFTNTTEFPFIEGFCLDEKISKSTFHLWVKQHDEFSNAYKKAKHLQEKHLVTNALDGTYNSTFAIFTAKNILGWRDVRDVNQNVNVSTNDARGNLLQRISKIANGEPITEDN